MHRQRLSAGDAYNLISLSERANDLYDSYIDAAKKSDTAGRLLVFSDEVVPNMLPKCPEGYKAYEEQSEKCDEAVGINFIKNKHGKVLFCYPDNNKKCDDLGDPVDELRRHVGA